MLNPNPPREYTAEAAEGVRDAICHYVGRVGAWGSFDALAAETGIHARKLRRATLPITHPEHAELSWAEVLTLIAVLGAGFANMLTERVGVGCAIDMGLSVDDGEFPRLNAQFLYHWHESMADGRYDACDWHKEAPLLRDMLMSGAARLHRRHKGLELAAWG